MFKVRIPFSFLVAVLATLAVAAQDSEKPWRTPNPARTSLWVAETSRVYVLLFNAAVRRELALTENQVITIDSAMTAERKNGLPKTPEEISKREASSWATLSKLLKPEQLDRLAQLRLQRLGDEALLDVNVQKELSLSSAQKDQIRSVAYRYQSELRKLQADASEIPITAQEAEANRLALLNEYLDGLFATLTPEQATQFRKMRGAEFKFPSG